MLTLIHNDPHRQLYAYETLPDLERALVLCHDTRPQDPINLVIPHGQNAVGYVGSFLE